MAGRSLRGGALGLGLHEAQRGALDMSTRNRRRVGVVVLHFGLCGRLGIGGWRRQRSRLTHFGGRRWRGTKPRDSIYARG